MAIHGRFETASFAQWPRSDCAWCGQYAQCHRAHGAGRGVEHGNAQVGEGAASHLPWWSLGAERTAQFALLVLGREWMGMGEWGNGGMGEWGNGMIININSICGSFLHSLLSTSKMLVMIYFRSLFCSEDWYSLPEEAAEAWLPCGTCGSWLCHVNVATTRSLEVRVNWTKRRAILVSRAFSVSRYLKWWT